MKHSTAITVLILSIFSSGAKADWIEEMPRDKYEELVSTSHRWGKLSCIQRSGQSLTHLLVDTGGGEPAWGPHTALSLRKDQKQVFGQEVRLNYSHNYFSREDNNTFVFGQYLGFSVSEDWSERENYWGAQPLKDNASVKLRLNLATSQVDVRVDVDGAVHEFSNCHISFQTAAHLLKASQTPSSTQERWLVDRALKSKNSQDIHDLRYLMREFSSVDLGQLFHQLFLKMHTERGSNSYYGLISDILSTRISDRELVKALQTAAAVDKSVLNTVSENLTSYQTNSQRYPETWPPRDRDVKFILESLGL